MKPKFDDGYEDGYLAGLRKAAELIRLDGRWQQEGPFKDGMRWSCAIISAFVQKEVK